MKLLTTIFSTIICLFSVFAQNESVVLSLEHETQIISYLGQEKFDQLASNNPSYLKYLDARCENGFKIIDYVEEKMHKFERIDSVNVLDFNDRSNKSTRISVQDFVVDYESSEFNILKYNIPYERTKVIHYILGSTGKVLVLMPVEFIAEESND